MVFTTLAHHLDEDFLTEAFHQLRKDAAAGIDQMTAAEDSPNLRENITDLHQRLVNRKYRAQPARRVWIPKREGSQRPLAILVLEDKIVQRAVAMLLEAVYEPHFHACSHGFGRGHSAHQAVSSLRDQCLKLGIHWIMDADLAKFFDTIAPLHLRAILQKRVRDGVVRRRIGRWLQVGVLEAGKVVRSETGTPQGGVISPSLANIFLHTVLDEWFETTVRPRLGGNCLLVRFADDFGMGFAIKSDAEKVFRVRPKRFERYGLKIRFIREVGV
jgi:group II intron reverse transcriptase/maturase